MQPCFPLRRLIHAKRAHDKKNGMERPASKRATDCGRLQQHTILNARSPSCNADEEERTGRGAGCEAPSASQSRGVGTMVSFQPSRSQGCDSCTAIASTTGLRPSSSIPEAGGTDERLIVVRARLLPKSDSVCVFETPAHVSANHLGEPVPAWSLSAPPQHKKNIPFAGFARSNLVRAQITEAIPFHKTPSLRH